MTATNHAITGALIASVVTQPILLIPVAFASHLVLDALPHFGEVAGSRKKLSKTVWLVDGVLLATLLLWLASSLQWIFVLGAIIAVTPDVAWVYRFLVKEKFGKNLATPLGGFNKFHAGIQKLESRRGLIVEVAWCVAGFYLLWSVVV